MVATVAYQIATYSGTVEVYFDDENTENDDIIARAKRQLRQRAGAFPLGMQSFRVVDRRETTP